mmetsp:Transcript_24615/g.56807  ORF Transcript_24615/g.56807 Transcript_24615/m.56807 type:complete len:175 (-) Transcript_24615:146-670(-)
MSSAPMWRALSQAGTVRTLMRAAARPWQAAPRFVKGSLQQSRAASASADISGRRLAEMECYAFDGTMKQIAGSSATGLPQVQLSRHTCRALQPRQVADGSFEALIDELQREVSATAPASRPQGVASRAIGAENLFVPSADWQLVPEDVICPAGLQFRLDMASGKTEARLLPTEE